MTKFRPVDVGLGLATALAFLTTGAGCDSVPIEVGNVAGALTPGQWTRVGDPSNLFFRPSAMALLDGRVLVLARARKGRLWQPLLYDPSTESFTVTAPMNYPVDGIVAPPLVRLADGRVVLVYDVTSPNFRRVEVFDPVTSTWSLLPQYSELYQSTPAVVVLMADGRIFLEDARGLATLYDPITGESTAVAGTGATGRGAGVLLSDGRVLLAPRSSATGWEVYDPVADSFRPIPNPSRIESASILVPLLDGRVLAAGGAVAGVAVPDTETFDPLTDTWSAGPALSVGWTPQAGTRLGNGNVLIAGFSGGAATSVVSESIDPTATMVIPLGTLATRSRGGLALAGLGTHGALAVACDQQSTAYVYADPASAGPDAGILDAASNPDAGASPPDASGADAAGLDAGADAGVPVTGPNLIVQDPTIRWNGRDLVADVAVCNRGTGPAAPGLVELFVSQDPVLDPSDVLLWAEQVDSPQLSPGSCHVLGAQVAPTPYLGGRLYLVGRVDAANVTAETDEGDNIGLSALKEIGGQDLWVRDVGLVGARWGSAAFEATICGTARTNATAQAGMSLAPEGPWVYWTGGGWAASPLGGGDCLPTLFLLSLPGVYPTIIADRYDQIAELDETDNILSYAQAVDLSGGPDLLVKEVVLPEPMTVGRRAVATICNVGRLPTASAASVELRARVPGAVSDLWGVRQQIPALPSLACVDEAFQLPLGTPPLGRLEFSVHLDPDRVTGDFVANNVYYAGARVHLGSDGGGLADLAVDRLRPVTYDAQSDTLAARVCNWGAAAAPSTGYAIKQTSLDDVPSMVAEAPQGRTLPPLEPMQCVDIHPVVGLSYGTMAADHRRLMLVLDAEGALPEVDEANNLGLSGRVGWPNEFYADQLDLSLERARMIWDANAEREAIELRVCNRGAVRSGIAGVMVYQTQTSVPVGEEFLPVATQSGEVVLDTDPAIEAGACLDVLGSLNWLGGGPQFGHENMLVDIGSGYTSRRTRQWIGPWLGWNKLAVADWTPPSVLVPDQTYDVAVDYCGLGGPAGSAPLTIDVMLSVDGSVAHGVSVGSVALSQPGLDVCGTVVVPVTVPMALWVDDADFQLGIYVSGGLGFDLTKARPVRLGLTGNLATRILSAPASGAGFIDADVEVCNNGAAALAGSEVAVYLSRDDTFEGSVVPVSMSDIVVGRRAVPPLGVNACVSLRVPLAVLGVTPGPRFLGAYVDPTDVVAEVLETDNTSAPWQIDVTSAYCGDLVVEGAEQCDDGNLVRGDGCDELCKVEVRAAQGEAIYTGANSQRLTHAITAAAHPLNPTSAFTLAMWAREPRNPWETPANRWDTGGQVWNFSHDSAGVMALAINDGTGSRANYRAFATRPGRSRAWVHYAMTYDRGTVHLYRNGVLNDGAVSGAIPAQLSGGTSDFHLGHWMYNGALGNVMFLDRAVTASEVADVYCALSDDPTQCACGADQHPCSASDVLNLPNLVAYWPLTSGPQDVVGGFDLTEEGTGWVYNDRTPVVSLPDAGVPDSGVPPDAGFPDTGVLPDAGFPDTGVLPDAGFPDTGVPPDAGFPDTGVIPDAGFPDTGVIPDAGFPDSGVQPVGPRARQGEAIYTGSNSQRLVHVLGSATHPLNPTDGFTLALWAREPATAWETPANRWGKTSQVWNFSHDSSGVLALTISDGTSSRANYREFATRPGTGRAWVHYAMTYAQGTVHLYRNGVLDDGPVRGTIPTVLSGGSADFALGHWLYRGAMGNVMFLDRAVSAGEVADIYCALSDDPTQCSCGVDQHACSVDDLLGMPGLVSYWPLLSGPEDVVSGYDLVEEGTNWVYNDRTPGPAPTDAGVPADSGVALDAGFPDSGVVPDAGFPDAGFPDSGVVDAGQPAPPPSEHAALTTGGAPARLEVQVPPGSSLDTQAFTLALWAQAPQAGEQVAQRWDAQDGDLWRLGSSAPGVMFFNVADDASTGDPLVGREFASAFGPGAWAHLIVTYDQGVVHLYRDGVADDGPVQGVLPPTLSGATPRLALGDGSYAGGVGQVLYFNRAVSGAEAQDLYCAFSPDPATCPCSGPSCALADALALPGLVSYWPLARDGFDEVGVNHLTEVSGPVTYTPGGAQRSLPPVLSFGPADMVLGQPDFVTNTANTGGRSAATMDMPQQCTSDGGRLWIADANNARLLQWNQVPSQLGQAADVGLGSTSPSTLSPGVGAGQFNALMGGPTTDGARLWVADRNNHRIKGWSTYPTSWGTPAAFTLGAGRNDVFGAYGTSPSQYLGPVNVRYLAGRLFVADIQNHRVLVYAAPPASTGSWAADLVVGHLGFYTQGPVLPPTSSSLQHPWDMEYDPATNQFFVADASNNRVMVWNGIPTANGQAAAYVLGQPDFSSNLPNQGATDPTPFTLYTPRGLYIQGNTLFVVDQGNRRVLVYSPIPTGPGAVPSAVLGQPDLYSRVLYPAGDSTFWSPWGVCGTPGRVWVVDNRYHRALSFPLGR
jgi:cysteine-rich repeat protein